MTKSYLLASTILHAAETGVGISAESFRASAGHMAERMSKETETELASLIQAKEDGKRGPIAMMFCLNADFGDDMDKFPIDGSEEGNSGNRWPEKYKADVHTADGVKSVDANFYTDFFVATPRGQQIQQRLDLLKIAKTGGADVETKLPKSGDNADIYENRNSPMWLDADMRKYNQRKATGRQLTKSAVKCWRKLNELAQHDEVVTIEYAMDGDKLQRTPYPITLCSVAKRAEFRVITATQLLKLDVDKAIKAGNGKLTYPNLIATLNKGTGTAPSGQKQLLKVEGELQDAFNAIANTLDADDEAGAKRVAAYRKLLDPKRASSDEEVLAFGNAYLAMDAYWREVEGRYNKLTGEANKAAA